MKRQIRYLLLLGSYDPKTRNLMNCLKDELLKRLVSQKILVWILDELEVYRFNGRLAIAEFWDENKASIYIERDGDIAEVYEITLKHTPYDEAVYQFLRKELKAESFERFPIFEKLKTLFSFSLVNVVIRDREETRGGELIELAYALMSGYADKTWLFTKRCIKISTMVESILIQAGSHMMNYRDETDLLEKVLELIFARERK